MRADASREHEQAVQAAQSRVDDTVAASDADRASRVSAEVAGVRAVVGHGLGGSRDALTAAAERARATLAASEGKVTDDAVRQALATALAEADAALAADAPGLSVVALRRHAVTTTAAEAAVAAAQQEWTQAQEAAAAAAAQRPRPAPGTGTGTGGSATPPSCETTYSGPPFYTSPPTDGGDGSNGKLPPSALAAISWDTDPRGTPYYLRSDAAAALERLNTAFRARFGHDLALDLTYRDYATQVAMRDALGSVAATPGTSSHGTGLALDVPELPCEYGWGTPQRDWLVANGPAYGWVVPSWARQNGSNPEYWHFEYRG